MGLSQDAKSATSLSKRVLAFIGQYTGRGGSCKGQTCWTLTANSPMHKPNRLISLIVRRKGMHRASLAWICNDSHFPAHVRLWRYLLVVIGMKQEPEFLRSHQFSTHVDRFSTHDLNSDQIRWRIFWKNFSKLR